MNTYNLSTKGVQSLFSKLVGRGLIRKSDYEARKQSQDSVIVDHDSDRLYKKTNKNVDVGGLLADLQSGPTRRISRAGTVCPTVNWTRFSIASCSKR